MKRLLLTALICLCPLVSNASEGEKKSFTQTVKKTFCNIFNSKDYSLLIPVNTWHNRYLYDKEKTDSYNERPWGFGFSKDYIDKNENRHSLFFMKFQDSHNKTEPFFGYAYTARWALNKKKDLFLLAGGTLGITAREEYNYIPFPAPLPIFGIEYKNFVLENTYIPGGKNNGNVLFTWIRWKF